MAAPKIDWKFVDGAEPQGSSDGFWYDLNNGYIKPEEVLMDEAQYQKVREAIAVLTSFESALEDADLLEDF